MQRFIAHNRKLLIVEAIVLIGLGICALALPLLSTLAIEMLIGWVFLAAGIIQFYRIFKVRTLPGFWPFLISALFYLICGLALIFYPKVGELSLTFIVAFFFLLDGIVKFIAGWRWRPLAGRFFLLIVGALVEIVLAICIFIGWPATAYWALGVLAGVQLIFFGSTLLGIAFAPR